MIPVARSFVRCFFPSFSNSLNRKAFGTCLSLRQIHLQQDPKTSIIDEDDSDEYVRRSEFRQSVDHIVKSIENAKNDLKADFDKKFAMVDQRFSSIDNEIADINKKVMTVDNKVMSIDKKVMSIDNKVMTIEKKINLMQQRNDSDHNSIVASWLKCCPGWAYRLKSSTPIGFIACFLFRESLKPM
jgi:hypothetical protein